MNVSSVSALWNDQTSSVVSALKNSSDPTISSFSKMLDQMMSNDATEASTSTQAAASALTSGGASPQTGSSTSKPASSASGASSSATAAAAKSASRTWLTKMADHFNQTTQAGSANTLLPDDNAVSQPQTWVSEGSS